MTEMDFWNLRGAAELTTTKWFHMIFGGEEEELPVQVEATEWSVSLLRVFKNFITRPDKSLNGVFLETTTVGLQSPIFSKVGSLL